MALAPPGLSTSQACALLQIARSGFYRSRRPRSLVAQQRAAERVRLRDRIEELCLEYRRIGYRPLLAQLRREGWQVGKARVQAIMQEESLQCQVRRSWVATTQSQHGLRRYPNRVPALTVTGLNQLWVADITYIRLQTQFIYLAVLLDSYSRRVVGWELGESLEAQLCVTALERALAVRQPAPGWVHHSDQGVQYASAAYVSLLEGAQAQISMARRGNPYDNAQAESFMKTLKREEVHLVEYEDLQHAHRRLARFLDEIYNTKRLHSRLGYLPPAEFEAGCANSTPLPGPRTHPLRGKLLRK